MVLQAVAVKAIAELADEAAEFSSVAVACLEKLAPQVLRTKVWGVLQSVSRIESVA